MVSPPGGTDSGAFGSGREQPRLVMISAEQGTVEMLLKS